jgi:hypothetical protein
VRGCWCSYRIVTVNHIVCSLHLYLASPANCVRVPLKLLIQLLTAPVVLLLSLLHLPLRVVALQARCWCARAWRARPSCMVCLTCEASDQACCCCMLSCCRLLFHSRTWPCRQDAGVRNACDVAATARLIKPAAACCLAAAFCFIVGGGPAGKTLVRTRVEPKTFLRGAPAVCGVAH